MNSIVGLVVASLLVVGIVAIAIPNAIEAKKSNEWCVEGTAFCFESKGQCLKFGKQGGPEPICVKSPI